MMMVAKHYRAHRLTNPPIPSTDHSYDNNYSQYQISPGEVRSTNRNHRQQQQQPSHHFQSSSLDK